MYLYIFSLVDLFMNKMLRKLSQTATAQWQTVVQVPA